MLSGEGVDVAEELCGLEVPWRVRLRKVRRNFMAVVVFFSEETGFSAVDLVEESTVFDEKWLCRPFVRCSCVFLLKVFWHPAIQAKK